MLLLARIEMEISALMDLFDFFVRLRPETLERCENFCRMQYSKFGKVCIELLLQDYWNDLNLLLSRRMN